MTSAPSDSDAERTRIAGGGSDRTRIVDDGDERTRISQPDGERTRIAQVSDEATRIASQGADRTRIASSGDDQTRVVDRDTDQTRLVDAAGNQTRIAQDDGATVLAPNSASSGSTAASHNALEVGTTIGEFEIRGVVGEGGFGIVYLAYDRSLDRQVALKEYMPAQLAQRDGGTVVMRSDRYAETFEAGRRSFINEARLLAQFDHHSLVKVYRFWEANGTAYMVMPFYEGITLKRALADLGAPPDEAWLKTLLAHLLDALEIIHNRQCYHRDIAPDNILILPDETPLLLDFGAARRVIGDMTQALTVILKPGYAPIEQYAEVPNMKQGPWTDLYALASVIYFAITGKPPVPSVARVMADPLTPLERSHAGRYSDTFLRALDRALSVKPEDRPQNIAEFRRSLGLAEREPSTRYVAGNERAAATPAAPAASVRPAPSALPGEARPATRSSTKAIIAGSAAAALIVGGYLIYALTDDAPAPPQAAAPPAAAPKAAPPAVDMPAAVAKALTPFECARLNATTSGGTATVRGHVKAEADLQKLRADLSSINGITRVDTEAVQVVPDVYCGVVSMLTPLAQQNAGAPTIRLRGGAPAAADGDKLVVELTGAKFPGVVYVDLYDLEGNVVHLFPNAKEKKNAIQPGQRMVVGDDPVFGMQWDVVPPLGKHLIAVTISRSPLFERARPAVERAPVYAGAIQEALQRKPQDVHANYRFIDFVPRR